eukprot:GHVU01008277.1.p1 GENE.GHVU01008277.1~~GHVU01008277.1.p1  ORF type:complete len:179 (-),score=24.38 GHVU01008277.1:484-1020(-)
MPVAHLMRWFEPPGFDWRSSEETVPTLTSERIVYIGLRCVDPPEAGLMREHHLACFDFLDVERYGIAEVIERAVATIDPHQRRPLYLTFDIDACDPSVAPGTGTKALGGLSYREAVFICSELRRTRRLVGADIVEVNPLLDTPQPRLHEDPSFMGTATTTVRLALRLAQAVAAPTIWE